MQIAGSITENIENASEETGNLKNEIDSTQHAMGELSVGTNDAANAIMAQQQSTEEIDKYIREVAQSTDSIIAEVDSTEENLMSANEVMNDLVDQVNKSETSSNLVAKKMEDL